MALDDDIAILRRVALFAPLSDEQLRLLAFGAEQHTISEGRALCRAGQASDGAFVLKSGQLALADEAGNETGVATQPGTLIGETALFHRGSWQVTAVAATACTVFRLPRPLFRRILEEYPDTAEALFRQLAGDLSGQIAAFERAAKRLG